MFLRLIFRNASRTKSLWSKGIAWWTDGPYSHVEFWFEGGPEDALTWGSIERVGTRSTLQSLETYDYVSISEDPKVAAEFYDYCKSLPHYSYDWLGLLGFMGPLKTHDGHDRFCSEICSEILVARGFLVFAEDRWKVSPNELAVRAQDKFGQLKPCNSLKTNEK